MRLFTSTCLWLPESQGAAASVHVLQASDNSCACRCNERGVCKVHKASTSQGYCVCFQGFEGIGCTWVAQLLPHLHLHDGQVVFDAFGELGPRLPRCTPGW